MTDERLRELLTDSADRIGVGPPPIAAIEAGSRRRTRTAVGAGVCGVAAALIVSAVAVGTLSDDGSGPGPASRAGTSPVDLPTSDWTPGEGGDAALISGRLRLLDGCVRLESGDFTTPVVWPKGWTAFTDADGVLGLVDADQEVVARGGDFVEMGGGSRSDEQYADQPCLEGQGEVGVVMSGVEVVEALPLTVPTNTWRPGDESPNGTSSAVLNFEGDCLFLGPRAKRRSVIWPADFSAEADPDGTIRLLGPEGQEVARVGDVISFRGRAVEAFAEPELAADFRCVAGRFTEVLSEVAVEPPAIDLPTSARSLGDLDDATLQIQGELQLDDGCIVAGDDTERFTVVWPADRSLSARPTADGGFVVIGADGRQVARDGDDIVATSGLEATATTTPPEDRCVVGRLGYITLIETSRSAD